MRNSECLRIVKLMIVAALAGMTGIACSNSSYTGKIVAVELPGTTGSQDHSALILIDPEASGRLDFVTREERYSGSSERRTVIVKNKIRFTTTTKLKQNTKYTITLDDAAVDAHGSRLTPYTFSFITRPE